MLKEKKFDFLDDLKISRNKFFGKFFFFSQRVFFSNLTGLPKESIPGYIGNQFALFLTKLNQANQGLLVRQYFERLNLLNDFRGEAARQFLLAVSRSPVPFFLSYVFFNLLTKATVPFSSPFSKRPPMPPITDQRPLYVQPRQSAARFAFKLFQLFLFILLLVVLMRQLGLGYASALCLAFFLLFNSLICQKRRWR